MDIVERKERMRETERERGGENKWQKRKEGREERRKDTRGEGEGKEGRAEKPITQLESQFSYVLILPANLFFSERAGLPLTLCNVRP